MRTKQTTFSLLATVIIIIIHFKLFRILYILAATARQPFRGCACMQCIDRAMRVACEIDFACATNIQSEIDVNALRTTDDRHKNALNANARLVQCAARPQRCSLSGRASDGVTLCERAISINFAVVGCLSVRRFFYVCFLLFLLFSSMAQVIYCTRLFRSTLLVGNLWCRDFCNTTRRESTNNRTREIM